MESEVREAGGDAGWLDRETSSRELIGFWDRLMGHTYREASCGYGTVQSKLAKVLAVEVSAGRLWRADGPRGQGEQLSVSLGWGGLDV